MKRYSERLKKFQSIGEERLNFVGDSTYGGTGFIGQGDYYGGSPLPGYGGAYGGSDSYAGENGLGVISEADRTYTVVVTNTNTAGGAVIARVFGAFTNPTDAQPAGVTVAIQETSHAQVRQESISNPFYIQGVKYIVTNVAQFSNALTLRRQNSTGQTIDQIIQPLTYRAALNNIATQIDAATLAFPVDGKTELRVPINPSESVTFIMQVKARGNIENILKGKVVTEVALGKVPTGVSTVDAR